MVTESALSEITLLLAYEKVSRHVNCISSGLVHLLLVPVTRRSDTSFIPEYVGER